MTRHRIVYDHSVRNWAVVSVGSIHYDCCSDKSCRREVMPSSKAYCKRAIGGCNEVGRRVKKGSGAIERLRGTKEQVTSVVFSDDCLIVRDAKSMRGGRCKQKREGAVVTINIAG